MEEGGPGGALEDGEERRIKNKEKDSSRSQKKKLQSWERQAPPSFMSTVDQDQDAVRATSVSFGGVSPSNDWAM
jgi:hypothetical protein